MPITELRSTDVLRAASTLNLSTLFAATAGSSLPAYLVINLLDRNEYTAASNADTGTLTGNGVQLALSSIGGDGRGCGIVFTWQASSGQYVNATYGTLSQLTYTASNNPGDITSLSLFGTSSATLAQQDAGNAYALMQGDAGGYIGSATIATEPGFTGTVPQAATPDGVAAAALSFVGHAWNQDGCWVLASTIAAEAGAALPVQSTEIGIPGHANGEWIVLYNGPVAASASWRNLISAGDVVAFATPGGGGHITTCVSGSGATAMLVDNITYVNGYGAVTNPANDGAAADVVVAPPHIASQEWSGVSAAGVVIYALDTPLVTDTQPGAKLAGGKSLALSALFSASDPAHRAVTFYQVYDTGADAIAVNGITDQAHSAATAVTVSSLGAAVLQAGMAADSDTVDVRAFNGLYWGDWQSAVVTVDPPAPTPPVLAVRTANQIWQEGAHVALALPAALFTDPQHEALAYAATQANGAALPKWLGFTPSTLTFAGAVPATPETLSIKITASDTSGLSASETFSITVQAASVAGLTAGDWPGQTGADTIELPGGAIAGGWEPTHAGMADIAWIGVHHV